MRHYETLFIIHPDQTEEDSLATAEEFSTVLTERGAHMVKVDHWGRRTLAYVVKKQKKGFFVLFEYGAGPEAVAEMERRFKIDERIIRYLTVKLDDDFDAEKLAAEAAAAEAKAQAQAQAQAARAMHDEDDDDDDMIDDSDNDD